MIERRIINRNEIPAEFFESRNVWNRYASARFHHVLHESGIEVVRKQGETVEDIDWIKSQLGGYDWDLVNMHLSQDHKVAFCAFMFSKVYDLIRKPSNLYEGAYVAPPPPTREEWLAQIRASAEKERKEEEERQEKIKSGEIVLPDPKRPYEIWIEGKRFKTGRSREALALSAEYAGLHPGSYREAYCSTDHEDSRKFFD